MLPALPPSIRPTFAVVSSSTRPRRRSAIARAAAAIAEREGRAWADLDESERLSFYAEARYGER